MAGAYYDAVVIGGGHHGTIIACYLGAAGLKVAVFERKGRLGGGATTSDGPAAGFLMNKRAHWTRFYGHPAYRDFDLHGEGLRYVFPDESQCMVFDDGSCIVGYAAFKIEDAMTGRDAYSQENVDRTREHIRRFSPVDADTYCRLVERYARWWKPALRRYRHEPPTAPGEPDALERLVEQQGAGLDPVHRFMTVRQLAYDFFDSAELRTLFIRSVGVATGCLCDDVVGLQGLIHGLSSALSFEPGAVAVGATQSVTDALVSAGRKRGVEYFGLSEVDEIVISGNTATGIRLAGGETVGAKLVVSGIGLPQTVLRLLRGANVEQRICRRLRNVHYDRGQLFLVNVALHEPPRYAAAAGDAVAGPQPRLLWGPKDPDYLATRYQPEIFLKGHPDRIYGYSAVDTLWDASRAPPGKHVATVNEFSAPRRLFAAEQWRQIKASFEAALMQQWRRYAPNMTGENIIAVDVVGPDDIEDSLPDMVEGGFTEGSMIASQIGRFRPIPELSGYRTIFENVYACSSNLHPGPGIGRGSSYNCFRLIAADHGLPIPSPAGTQDKG